MSKPLPAESPPVRPRLTLQDFYDHQTKLKRYAIRRPALKLPMETKLKSQLKLFRPESYLCRSFNPRYVKTNSYCKPCSKLVRLARPKRNLTRYFPDAFHLASLLVHRREFISGLLCLTNSLYGLVTSNPQLTFLPRTEQRLTDERLVNLAKLEAGNETQEGQVFYIFISSFQLKSLAKTNTSSLLCLSPWKIQEFTSSLPCLYMSDGFLSSKSRSTIKLDNLTSNEQFRIYLSRILPRPRNVIAEGSLKESRQKRVFVKEKRKHNFKTAILQQVSLVEAFKESRQKRLVVKHRKNNLKIVLLQYFIDTAANTIRLHSLGGINLDSPSSKKHTMYTYVNVFPVTSSLPCLTLALVSKESRQKSWGDKNDMYKVKNAILCTLCSTS